MSTRVYRFVLENETFVVYEHATKVENLDARVAARVDRTGNFWWIVEAVDAAAAEGTIRLHLHPPAVGEGFTTTFPIGRILDSGLPGCACNRAQAPSETDSIEHGVIECIARNSFGHLLAVKAAGAAEWEMA